MLSFIVYARQEIKAGKIIQYEPEPQGSARALILPKHKYPVVVHDNPGTKRWRKTISDQAEFVIFYQSGPARRPWFAGPVAVRLAFYFLRPKSNRNSHHVVRPDLDKLCRAVLDGLKEGGVFHDDSQVCSLVATKQYGKDKPGCEIEVCSLQEEEQPVFLLRTLPARSDPPSIARARDKQRSAPTGTSSQLAIEGI